MNKVTLSQSPIDATRTERLRFQFAFNRKQAKAHAADVRIVNGGTPPPTIMDDDTLTVKYEVSCEYFGTVEARLAAVSRLLDVPGLTREVNLDELNYGHSIFVNIIRQIEALQAKIKQ